MNDRVLGIRPRTPVELAGAVNQLLTGTPGQIEPIGRLDPPGSGGGGGGGGGFLIAPRGTGDVPSQPGGTSATV